MRRRLSDYRAFARSLVKQGLLEQKRRSYWKFIYDAATRYRHAFDIAVTLAIMGYHFEKITEKVLRRDPAEEGLSVGLFEPGMEQSI
jgi:hypothetical protein